MRKKSLLFAVVMALGGCATAPPPSTIQAELFLPAGQVVAGATGTVWADRFLQIAAVDGKATPYSGKGTVAQSQAIGLRLAAGHHKFILYSPALAGNPRIDFDVRAGHTYLLKITPEPRIETVDLGPDGTCEASYLKLGIANYTHNVVCSDTASSR